ncbi:MAG: hypothetical protein MSQ83_03880 [Phascolarctobacterium sp.]|nr:hypothetical protein [Phascolarctobacterium sp.]
MTIMMSLGLCSSALAAENDGVVGFVNIQAMVTGGKDLTGEVVKVLKNKQ